MKVGDYFLIPARNDSAYVHGEYVVRIKEVDSRVVIDWWDQSGYSGSVRYPLMSGWIYDSPKVYLTEDQGLAITSLWTTK